MYQILITALITTMVVFDPQPNTEGNASSNVSAQIENHSHGPFYNKRYCEVLLAQRKGTTIRMDVYASMGCNDCPQTDWNALDLDQIAKEHGVMRAVPNGPRYTLMDDISREGGKPVDFCRQSFGNLEMSKIASLDVPIHKGMKGKRGKPYREMKVARNTVWHFNVGSEVFVLTDPNGVCYVMQSYSHEVDGNLNPKQLSELGARLKLPKGWTFNAIRLTENFDVSTQGDMARVLQDDFKNTYQWVDSGCLK